MRRAAKIHRVELAPDARYANVLVTRFINCLMLGGKKSTAERIFYVLTWAAWRRTWSGSGDGW